MCVVSCQRIETLVGSGERATGAGEIGESGRVRAGEDDQLAEMKHRSNT